MLKVAAFLLVLTALMVPAHAVTLEGYKGDLYVGAVRNGVPHGKGVKTWPNGHRYEGDWNNGEREGKGDDKGGEAHLELQMLYYIIANSTVDR